MRAIRAVALALGWWLAGAGAQEAQPEPKPDAEQPEQGPDLDFLEYLGAWAEDDDEWLAIEQWQRDNKADEEREAPESERDDDDESE